MIDPSPQIGTSQNIVLHGSIADFLTYEDASIRDRDGEDCLNEPNKSIDDLTKLLPSQDRSTIHCNPADQSTPKRQKPRRFPVRPPAATSVPSPSSAFPSASTLPSDEAPASSDTIRLRAYGEHCRSWLEGFVPSVPKSRLSEIEGIAVAHQVMQDRDTYRAFVTIDLTETEAKQPRDVIQNLIREIRRISDQRPSYFAAFVQKAGAEHLHAIIDITPGSLAWNALDAWAERQNGKWPSRVRFDEITCDKGGLAGVIAYLIGPRNLNRHPGGVMRSNDLIKAVTALAATMPAKARHKPADASEPFQGSGGMPPTLTRPCSELIRA